MKEVTYYVRGDVRVGKVCKVFAKDKLGATVGEYDGYYKPERGVFVLYPAKKSHVYGKLQKHEVAVALVRRCG